MSGETAVRRKRFVNPKIQGRLLSKLCSYWLLYHVALWHAMFLCHYLQYQDHLAVSGTAVPFSSLYLSFASQNATLVACAALVFPLFLWDALLFSHRVIGPLVRIQNTFRKMSEGKQVERLQFREGDLLDELRDAFNDYLDSLVSKEQNMQPAVIVESQQAAVLDNKQTVAASTRNRDDSWSHDGFDDYSAIQHDLRDIQETVAKLKQESPRFAATSEPNDWDDEV